MKPSLEELERLVDERARQEGPQAVARLEATREQVRLVTALAARRKELKLSQRQLAALTGLHQCDISDIEAGKVNPGTRTVLAIAIALDAEMRLVPRPREVRPKRASSASPARAKRADTRVRASRSPR